MLNAVDDYTHLTSGSWTTDDHLNALVADLIHNYKIKENDFKVHLEERNSLFQLEMNYQQE